MKIERDTLHTFAVLVLLIVLILIATMQAHPQSKPNPQSIGAPSGNVVWYATGMYGANAGAKIDAAMDSIEANSITGGIVDARGFKGVQTITTNIFANRTKAIQVLLGHATFLFDSQLTILNKSQLIMAARGDSGTAGTILKASSTFPNNTAGIYLGGASQSFNVYIEGGTVDMSSRPGSIGILSTNTQEQSGVRNVLVSNFDSIGIFYNSTGSSLQNSFIENVEVYASATCNADAIGIYLKGVAAFRGVHGATINTNGSAQAGIGIKVDATSGTLANIHIERYTEGIVLGRTTAIDGIHLDGITGHTSATVTRLIVISAVTSNQNIVLTNINKGASSFILADSMTSRYFSSETAIGDYSIGDGSGSLKTVWHTQGGYKTIRGEVTQAIDASTTQAYQTFKTSSTPNTTWRNTFYAYDGRGTNLEYAAIGARIDDTTYNSIDGTAIISGVTAGSLENFATFSGTGINVPSGKGLLYNAQPTFQSDTLHNVSTSGRAVTLTNAHASAGAYSIEVRGYHINAGSIVPIIITSKTASGFTVIPGSDSTNIEWKTTLVTQ